VVTGTVQDELPVLNYSVLRRQARFASDGCSSAVVIVARCLVVNSDDLVKTAGRSQPATSGVLESLESQGCEVLVCGSQVGGGAAWFLRSWWTGGRFKSQVRKVRAGEMQIFEFPRSFESANVRQGRAGQRQVKPRSGGEGQSKQRLSSLPRYVI
jgi:hypothetical protein